MIHKYAIEDKTLSSETAFESHIHKEYEINFMLSDNVEVVTRDKTFVSKRGDVFIFPPFIFHKVFSLSPFSRFLMFFDENEMCMASNALKPIISTLKIYDSSVIHIADDNINELINLFTIAEKEQHKNDYCSEFLNISFFGNILVKIISCANTTMPSSPLLQKKGSIQEILQYIDDNIANELTVKIIASHFKMSRNSLYELMHKQLGISPKEYILNTRISKAIDLLQSDCKIYEIATLCGFNNYNHFSRIFTSTLGVSPNKYRKQIFNAQTKPSSLRK